jgi:DNA repair protein RadC
MAEFEEKTGHRRRLRQSFLINPAALTKVQLLELLLTYAIPRQDVAPLAHRLITHFGSIEEVMAASIENIQTIPGVGLQTAMLIKVAARLNGVTSGESNSRPEPKQQPALFELNDRRERAGLREEFAVEDRDETMTVTDDASLTEETEPAIPGGMRSAMRTFANDEIANSLTFIPQAAQFNDIGAFKAYLAERLPYNSASTRQRRANNILDRFYPQERLDIPLTYYTAHCTSTTDLKPALFYHVLKAEPLAAKVAEEFIWPALPTGSVEREAIREFILRYLPDIAASSQKNALHSILTTYDLLSVGVKEGDTLRFQVHSGTFEAFLYLLTAEFPQPGMYTFEAVEEGPLRRWLLWDREWMRRQLYNLRDFGIISKVSEIDFIRQFTLEFNQATALRHYFEHPQREMLVLRETLAVS